MRSLRHLDVQGYQMSKYEKDLQKNIERRTMMRAGRADEAAETVRALLRPIESTNANRLHNDENTTTVELHDSILRCIEEELALQSKYPQIFGGK